MTIGCGEGSWSGRGGILGALWLVLPSARRLPRAAWVGFGVAVAVLVVRPRLALYGLAVAAVSSVMAFVAGCQPEGASDGHGPLSGCPGRYSLWDRNPSSRRRSSIMGRLSVPSIGQPAVGSVAEDSARDLTDDRLATDRWDRFQDGMASGVLQHHHTFRDRWRRGRAPRCGRSRHPRPARGGW